jgi:hypothetical protein
MLKYRIPFTPSANGGEYHAAACAYSFIIAHNAPKVKDMAVRRKNHFLT